MTLAAAEPDLTLVLDHLGKPPGAAEGLARWAEQVRALAQHPQVVAKVSGLQSAAATYDVAALRPAWDVALEAFGPQRLMFGSDWPMIIDGPGYAGVVEASAQLIGELSESEQHDLWWRTAARTYRLDVDQEDTR